MSDDDTPTPRNSIHIYNLERNSVTNMARMFETKVQEFSRKSSTENNRSIILKKEDATEDDPEVDDIFDDIIMPDSSRKTSTSISEKVDMFNKADPSNAQKIIETVSALGESQPYVRKSSNNKPNRWVEGGTFEADDGTFTTRRKKSAILQESPLKSGIR
jgi:hypothetical protein